ncbi:MAG TPA: hypothetical protein VID04_03255 [Methylomirabilota bacterium]
MLAVPVAVLTMVVLSRPRLPAMLVILAIGVVVAVFREPHLLGDLAGPGERESPALTGS